MTSFGFIIRRIARSMGFSNEAKHLRSASQLTHYLTEAEDMLGHIAWRDVADVPLLSEEHWKIREIESQQERLEEEIQDIEDANDKLIQKRDKLELETTEILASISADKTDAMRDALALIHEVEACQTAGERTKKKYSGLRIKLKVLNERGGKVEDTGDINVAMESLKADYAIDKQKSAALTAKIHEAEDRIAQFEAMIDTVRREARQPMAEIVNRVSKSSKLVADYTARIGALEATKKSLSFKIGIYLTANSHGGDPDILPVLKKHKNILSKIAQLRQSIRYHRILAGREEHDA